MRIQLYMPWNNLGCLGVRVGRFYADIYRRTWVSRWSFPFGMFVNTGKLKLWVTPSGVRTDR